MGANRVSAATAAAESSAPQRNSTAGRRRDPTIDARLRQAARILYGREGWAGLHFEGVARAAGVSKDAVYRRYADAQSLLLDALSDQALPALADDVPVEEALVAYACEVFAYFASGNGYANLRVHIDAAQYPDVLHGYRTRVVEPQIQHAVGVLERAREDGKHSPGDLVPGRDRGAGRGRHGPCAGDRSDPWRGRRCAQSRHGAPAHRIRPADPLWTADRRAGPRQIFSKAPPSTASCRPVT